MISQESINAKEVNFELAESAVLSMDVRNGNITRRYIAVESDGPGKIFNVHCLPFWTRKEEPISNLAEVFEPDQIITLGYVGHFSRGEYSLSEFGSHVNFESIDHAFVAWVTRHECSRGHEFMVKHPNATHLDFI